MSEPNFYPEDIIIGKSSNGRVRYGLIEKTVDMESDDESDSDMDDYSDNELEPGHVRLTWYPEGSEETVHESKIQLVDRSTLPRDVVHEMNGSQLGTVLDVDVHCDVAVVGTNKILKNIHCKSLKRIYPLMDGDLVAYGPWVGHISSAVGLLVLRFSNGARGKINLQDDSCEQLDDLYPHASDDGSFFDSEFYPGQVLSGPAKCFRKMLWFPGVPPPNLKSKSRFKVILEQLELAAVHVKWIQRAFSSPNERKKDDKPTSPSDKSKPDPTLSAELGAKTELTEYERKLCLSTNPAEPPPDVIHGEHLKYLKTLQYFWTGNLVLGTRMQYQLTANDVEQLNLQPNNEKKLKRTRRVYSTRKMDRKMARMSDSASAIPPAKRKGDRKSSKSKETRNNQEDSEDDLSNTEDQNHDVNEFWEDAADVAGGDQEQRCEDLDKDEEEKDDIDKFCYSTDPLPNSFACQLGDFSLKFSVTGKEKQALNVNLENPNCSPEILKALSEGLEAEISPIRRSKFYWRGGISSNKMVAKLLKLLRKLSLQMNLLQDENIKYEYKVGENTVSGYMDNTGKQVELTFTGDSEQKTSDDGCESEVPNQGPSNETLNNWDGNRFTSGPIAQRQAGPKVIFQPGQNVTVEVVCTHTTADIEWQDGTMSRGIPSTGVRQAHHVDDNDFCPGDFVYDEANSGDVHLYGLILSADNANRMAIV
nr:(E3-independent) E2 ubiquitin-conjugating enzyme UBE2O-like isoform X2 [Ciona intestinalis]|eukprot:XP_026689701.1 (E3-independent) E2 ubiquitin-conjugating enzyme UBE2O-like isoform X2 [Ciona intestinalis]